MSGMSWLKKDLRLIGATAEEEFYDALRATPCDPGGPRWLPGGVAPTQCKEKGSRYSRPKG